MLHWLHRLLGRERLLCSYAAGELSPAERPRVESALAGCPACRRDVEVYRLAIEALREAPRAHLAAAEAAAFLPGVNRRIDDRAGAARPTRPGLREILWDHPRLGVASALVGALLIAGLTLAQLQLWGVAGTAGLNEVEVLSLDVDEDAAVVVFHPPGTSLKVIWVFENSSS